LTGLNGCSRRHGNGFCLYRPEWRSCTVRRGGPGARGAASGGGDRATCCFGKKHGCSMPCLYFQMPLIKRGLINQSHVALYCERSICQHELHSSCKGTQGQHAAVRVWRSSRLLQRQPVSLGNMVALWEPASFVLVPSSRLPGHEVLTEADSINSPGKGCSHLGSDRPLRVAP
jgi:hypothetical protein